MNDHTQTDPALSPEVTVAGGQAAIHAAAKVWRHARSEFDAQLESVMPTIAEGRDLVYALAGDASGMGELVLGTTRADAEDHYKALYKDFHVRNWQPFVEIRTPWYVFFDGVVTMLDRSTGQTRQDESLVLFNLCDQEGILGEMAWSRNEDAEQIDRDLRQTGTAAPAALNRVSNLALHERYVASLCNADMDALLATMHTRPNMALRNYLPDAEKEFIGLMSADAIADYFAGFWNAYRVDSIDAIRVVAGDWYIFTELQWNVVHAGTGQALCWHTVEFCPIVGEGVIKARVGYGTEAVERNN